MASAEQLPRYFPSMRLRFAGEVDLPLPPQNYLFGHFDRDGAYCLGIFQNVQDGSLIGGITFRDILVQVRMSPCLEFTVFAWAAETLGMELGDLLAIAVAELLAASIWAVVDPV